LKWDFTAPGGKSTDLRRRNEDLARFARRTKSNFGEVGFSQANPFKNKEIASLG
jgi:hypothetical protein